MMYSVTDRDLVFGVHNILAFNPVSYNRSGDLDLLT